MSAAAGGLFPAQTEAQVLARISAMMGERRLTAGALGALCSALEAQPHADTGEPADAPARNRRDRCMADAMRDAGQTVRDATSDKYERTPYVRAQGVNLAFVRNETDEGDVNTCAICLEEKDACLNVAEHFGAKGESPPYTLCPGCGCDFYSHYDSQKNLALHLAAEGECKPEEREKHERFRNMPPRPLSASCWGAPRPAKKARKSRAKGAQGAKGGAVAAIDVDI